MDLPYALVLATVPVSNNNSRSCSRKMKCSTQNKRSPSCFVGNTTHEPVLHRRSTILFVHFIHFRTILSIPVNAPPNEAFVYNQVYITHAMPTLYVVLNILESSFQGYSNNCFHNSQPTAQDPPACGDTFQISPFQISTGLT